MLPNGRSGWDGARGFKPLTHAVPLTGDPRPHGHALRFRPFFCAFPPVSMTFLHAVPAELMMALSLCQWITRAITVHDAGLKLQEVSRVGPSSINEQIGWAESVFR